MGAAFKNFAPTTAGKNHGRAKRAGFCGWLAADGTSWESCESWDLYFRIPMVESCVIHFKYVMGVRA